MSVRVCALGRPLECDSRPAQWQETPWRLWQAASCTPSFAFRSLTRFSSLCYSSFSTYNSSSPLLHLYSLHSYHTCLSVFLLHSSAQCFLGSSQRDLNNWTFVLPYFFAYFCFCLNQWTGLSIFARFPLFNSFLSPSLGTLSSGSDVSCPWSDPFGLCNLAQQVLISKSHLLSLPLLCSSHHPVTSWTPEGGNYPCPRKTEQCTAGVPRPHMHPLIQAPIFIHHPGH